MATKKPHPSNQSVVDPRQAEFLNHYLDPKSKTFSNVYRSGIAAGYSESYAEQLKTKVNWLPETTKSVTKDELVVKAKRNLDKLLDSTDEKVQADITKFVAKTDIEFSEKSDITSNGKEIQPLLVRFVEDDKE